MGIEYLGPLETRFYDDEVRQAALSIRPDDTDFADFAVKIHRTEYNPKQWTSPAGAKGQMQLMPATAKALGVDPNDTKQNILGGVRYLDSMLTKYGGNKQLAAAAYNAGPGAVDKYGGVPPFPETKNYVNKVAGGTPSGWKKWKPQSERVEYLGPLEDQVEFLGPLPMEGQVEAGAEAEQAMRLGVSDVFGRAEAEIPADITDTTSATLVEAQKGRLGEAAGHALTAADIAMGGPVYREYMGGGPQQVVTPETFPQQVPMVGPARAVGQAAQQFAQYGPAVAPQVVPESFPEAIPVGMSPEAVGQFTQVATELAAYPQFARALGVLSKGAGTAIVGELAPYWYRMTVRERGLVAQSAAQQVQALQEMGASEGEILRFVKQNYGENTPFFQRAMARRATGEGVAPEAGPGPTPTMAGEPTAVPEAAAPTLGAVQRAVQQPPVAPPGGRLAIPAETAAPDVLVAQANIPKTKTKPEIGETINFIRYGNPVENSVDWQTGNPLPGMSVYSLNEDGSSQQTIRSEFYDRKKVFIGTGRVIDYGSDGEPLVVDYSLREATKLEDEKAYYGGISRSQWLKENGYDEKGNKLPAETAIPETTVQEAPSDLTNQPGIPSQVIERQTPQQIQPYQEASQEKIAASGILQAQGEIVEPEVPVAQAPTAAPVQPVTPEVQPEAKEPWQMTRDEFVRSQVSDEGLKQYEQDMSTLAAGKGGTGFATRWNAIHDVSVRDAISEGKPVPPEVLAEYPELQKTAPAAEPTEYERFLERSKAAKDEAAQYRAEQDAIEARNKAEMAQREAEREARLSKRAEETAPKPAEPEYLGPLDEEAPPVWASEGDITLPASAKDYSQEDLWALEHGRQDLNAADSPILKRVGATGAEGTRYEKLRTGNPDWYKNQGWTKKEVNTVVDKVLAGKALTPKQKNIADAIIMGKYDEYRRLYADIQTSVEPQDLSTKVEGGTAYAPGTAPEEPPWWQPDPSVEYYTKGGMRLGAERRVPSSGYSFVDKNVEAEFQKYKGVPGERLVEKLKLMATRVKNRATRTYETLPEKPENAPLLNALLQLTKQKDVASYKTLKAIEGIREGLDRQTNDIFERKVILDDLAYTASQGMALPHPFDEATVTAELTRLDSIVANSPTLQRAIARRQEFWESLKNDYIQAMKDAGFNVDNRFNNPAYFRHQVLEYATLRTPIGTGKKLQTPTGRGFLKKREGSTKPINYDYAQAEHEIMAQMLFDIQVAKTIKSVDENYNIINQCKLAALEHNDKEIMPFFEGVAMDMSAATPTKPPVTAEQAYRRVLHTKQAIGFSKLGKMAADGALPDTPDGRYTHVIEELAESYLEAKALNETLEETGEEAVAARIDDRLYPELFKYMAWLLKEGKAGAGPAAAVFKGIRHKKEFIKTTLGPKYKTWENMIPDGYILWQPREGQVFYLADSIPARLAKQLLDGKVEELGLKKPDLEKVFAMGGKRREFVIPEDVAATLGNLYPAQSDNLISTTLKYLTRGWKVWQLLSPRRFGKYNFRNLTGDAEALFVGNPKGFAKSRQAFSELFEVMVMKKEMSPTMQGWFERGGIGSTLQAQEMDEFHDLPTFRHLYEQSKNVQDIPERAWRKYWNAVRLSTDLREATLRYAAYLDYLDQMKGAANGLPKNFGASRPDYIKMLDDTEDRAYWLSNDLLGPYDRVSAMGRDIRSFLMPFWSWKEVNFKRYIQLFKNAAHDEKLSEAVGRKFIGAATRTPFIAMRIGKFLIMASAFWAALEAYNNTRFPDEEKDLPPYIKNRPHIVFGRDKDGNVEYFSRVGMLGDFLEWFGLDAFPKHVNNWMSGKKNLKEISLDMAKSPANVLVQSANWLPKLAGELLTRRALFPDFTKPGTIRDRGLHAARAFGLENEYIAIMGLPSRGYPETLKTIMKYKINPLESAYRQIQDQKREYLSKIGKEYDGFWITPKGQALYNMKLAMKYEDAEAAKRYMAEYITLAGNGKDISDDKVKKQVMGGVLKSLATMAPLSGMSVEEKIGFIGQLDKEDKTKLERANQYYRKVLLNLSTESNRNSKVVNE